MKNLIPLCALLFSTQTLAGITAQDCTILEPAPSAARTGLFLKINFAATEEINADQLIAAKIPELSDQVEIHDTKMKDGVMHMQQIKTLPLESNGVTELKRGGLHIMLMDMKKRPQQGEKYDVRLEFENHSAISCEATVIKRTAKMTHKHNH